MFSTYSFRPKFQEILRPWAQRLVNRGVTANQISVCSVIVSVVLGLLLVLLAKSAWLFWLLVFWFVLRGVLCTLDGLMAQEFMQESAKGGYLNELGDLVSEAALYLPFTMIVPWGGALAVGLFIWLSAIIEITGVLGLVHGFNGRRYDGPLGKSDRALVFGILAVWYALVGNLNIVAAVLVWLLVVAAGYTCWIRMEQGLKISAVDTHSVDDGL